MYEQQVKRGKDYSEVKRIVLITIIGYKMNLTKDLKEMKTVWTLREKE